MDEHDATKGPGHSARDEDEGIGRAGGEVTYTVHIDRTGEVPTVTLSLTKLGIAVWKERPMAEGDWMALAMILRDG